MNHSSVTRPLGRLLSCAVALSLLAGCAELDAPMPRPGMTPSVAPETVTVTPRNTPQAVIRIPPATATIDVAAILATGTPSPTETPTPAPTAQAVSTPTKTPVGATQSGFAGLLQRPVPEIIYDTEPESGFTSTVYISTTQVGVVDGQLVTTVVQVDVGAVPAPVTPLALPPGTINIALLGTDTRPKEGGLNTDVIIIASVHPTLPVVTLLSIPRDTMVYIPNQRMHKVNTAYRRGGESGSTLFKQTILYNFGINVDYFAMVNFFGVVNAVNTLGGIEVIATCPLYQVFPADPFYYADEANPSVVTKPYTNSFTGEVWQPGMLVPTQTIWIPRPGVYALNGMQALAYTRARYGVPGGDIDRGRRAQRMIRALLSKARQSESITQIPHLYEQFQSNVTTDLALSDMIALAAQANQLDDFAIRSRFFEGVGLTSVTLPVVGSVLIPNRDNITSYLEQALAVNENVRANSAIPIEVWNATPQEDFGIAVSDRMRELGFTVVNLQQVDPLSKTQLIDFSTSNKGSAIPLLTKSLYLNQRQVIAQPQEAPANGARYRLIAGQDFDPCYFRAAPQTARAATPAPGTPVATEPAPAGNVPPPAAPPQPPPPQPEPPPQPAPPAQPTAAP